MAMRNNRVSADDYHGSYANVSGTHFISAKNASRYATQNGGASETSDQTRLSKVYSDGRPALERGREVGRVRVRPRRARVLGLRRCSTRAVVPRSAPAS